MVKFSSPRLQKIANDAEIITTQHIARLNNLSGNIKLLISNLKKAGIPFTYIYVIKANLRQQIRDITTYEEHCLVWGKGKNGNYQLMYNIYVSHKASNQETPRHRPIIKPISSTPILSLKASLRLKLEAELGFFYENIVDSLQKFPLEKQRIVTSPIGFFIADAQLSYFSVQTF